MHRAISHLLLRTITTGSAIATFAIGTQAQATLNTSVVRGEKMNEITTQGRAPEICVIPKHLGRVSYSEKDLQNEKDLCALDEYTNAAFCPKVTSTNPGVNVIALPLGFTPAQVEATNCVIRNRTTGKDVAKKLAKYKLSTSCSYTPSILAYYHVSRMLGGILNIPVSVIRTLSLKKHLAIGRRALDLAPEDDIIHTTWEALYDQLSAGSQASKRDLLLTSRFDQSYGALLQAPKSDFFQSFFHGGDDPTTRAINFRDNNPAMKRLASSAAMSLQVGRDFNALNVQKMANMKDAADMIVIDTLLSQQDRYGNIDAVDTFAYLDLENADDSGAPVKMKSKLEPEQAARLGAVQIKRVLLSDNDCGVSKDNISKEVGLANRLLHLDPKTYAQLLRLDAAVDQPDTKAFFTNELLFTDADFARFRANLKELAAKFHGACIRGKLTLDLGLQDHFSKLPLQNHGCEF